MLSFEVIHNVTCKNPKLSSDDGGCLYAFILLKIGLENHKIIRGKMVADLNDLVSKMKEIRQKVMKLARNVDVNASVTSFLVSCMFSIFKFVKNLMNMVL